MISKSYTAFMIFLSIISNLFIYLQGYKVWIRNSHDDISLISTLFGFLNSLFWGYYGILLSSTPLILSGFLASLAFFWLLLLKFTISLKNADEWKYL